MWDRIDLKMRGKECFRKNYAQTVLASLIFVLISSNFTAQVNNGRKMESSAGRYLEGLPVTIWIAGTIFATAAMVLSILVFNVLKVGVQRFFIENVILYLYFQHHHFIPFILPLKSQPVTTP